MIKAELSGRATRAVDAHQVSGVKTVFSGEASWAVGAHQVYGLVGGGVVFCLKLLDATSFSIKLVGRRAAIGVF